MRISAAAPPRASTTSYQALTQWYGTPLGQHLLHEERRLVDRALGRRFGYQLVQLGCADLVLHQASPMGHKFSFCPHAGIPHCHGAVAQNETIPLAATSVDLVLLHHALDFSSQPHQVLREASRVLIAGGHMVIVGFNPLSTWGLRNRLHWGRAGRSPWEAARLTTSRLSDWLSLLDFQIDGIHHGVYVPPVNHVRAIRWSQWLEPLARSLNWPTGAIYVICARKQVAPLTPIQMPWRKVSPRVLPGQEQAASRAGDNHCGRGPTLKQDNHVV